MTVSRYDWSGPWPRLLPPAFGAWLPQRALTGLSVALSVTIGFFLIAASLAGYRWSGYALGAVVFLALTWRDILPKRVVRY
jgi:hypothetical protein